MDNSRKTTEEMRARTSRIKAHVNDEIEELRSDPDPAGTHEAAQEVIQERVQALRTEYQERMRNAPRPQAKGMQIPSIWMGIGFGLLAAGLVTGYLALRKKSNSQEMRPDGGVVVSTYRRVALPDPYQHRVDVQRQRYIRGRTKVDLTR